MSTLPLPTISTNPVDPGQARQRQIQENALFGRTVKATESGYILIGDATIGGNYRAAFQSPNGHWWTVSVSNAGAFVFTDVGTTPP